MSVLVDLANVLQTAGVGTVGTNIFLSQLPVTPEEAIALGEYGSSAPVWSFDGVMWEQPRVQVLVRTSLGYASGRTWVQNAWNALNEVRNQTINNIRYVSVECLQSPFELAREGDGDDITFAFNVEVWKQVG